LLDMAAGGSFTHKTMEEGEVLLDCILENTPPLEPIRVEPEPCHKDASSAETEITPPSETPSPEPHIPKESLSGHISTIISVMILEIIRSMIRRT